MGACDQLQDQHGGNHGEIYQNLHSGPCVESRCFLSLKTTTSLMGHMAAWARQEQLEHFNAVLTSTTRTRVYHGVRLLAAECWQGGCIARQRTLGMSAFVADNRVWNGSADLTQVCTESRDGNIDRKRVPFEHLFRKWHGTLLSHLNLVSTISC